MRIIEHITMQIAPVLRECSVHNVTVPGLYVLIPVVIVINSKNKKCVFEELDNSRRFVWRKILYGSRKDSLKSFHVIKQEKPRRGNTILREADIV